MSERARFPAPLVLRLLPFLALLCAVEAAPAAARTKLYGSGATTVQLFLTRVARNLNSKHKVSISYNPIGSGGGKDEFVKKKSGFCASDVPLTAAEESRIGEVKYTLPLVLQTISVFTNIPGIRKKLKFSPSVLAKIFQGKITRWNSTELVKLNPILKNVRNSMYVVVRGDKSGTTALFTEYLQRSTKLWQLGAGTSVKFPSRFLIGIGNTGVVSTMRSSQYSIGYAGSSIGNQLGLVEALIQNLAKDYLTTSQADLYSSLPRVLPAPSKSWAGVSLVLKPGRKTWPITAFLYLLVRKDAESLGKTGGLLVSFLRYLFSNSGQTLASQKYLFIKIPSKLLNQNVAAVNKIVLAPGVKPPF